MKNPEKQIYKISKIFTNAANRTCEELPFQPNDKVCCRRPVLNCRVCKEARAFMEAGYREQTEVIDEFVKRFESYIGNCTFTLGQVNDIVYALKKAKEDILEETVDEDNRS